MFNVHRSSLHRASGIPRACPNYRRVAASEVRKRLRQHLSCRFALEAASVCECRVSVLTLLSLTHAPPHRSAPATDPPRDRRRTTTVHKPARAVSPVDAPPPGGDNAHVRHVSTHTYGELEQFAKYASAAYQYLCPRPLENTPVQSVSCARASRLLVVCSLSHLRCLLQFSNVLKHAHGFVARDDRR